MTETQENEEDLDIYDEEEAEYKAESEVSVVLDIADIDTGDTGVYKAPAGPRIPRSAPDLLGLNEEEVTRILQEFSDEEIEDLFNKNTESFKCLAQVLISRSSLLRHILYHFPVLQDPGIDDAFDYVEPEPQCDEVGIDKYKSMCKDMNIVPITRVIRSLRTDTLNLKYYGLSEKQFKAIASCVMFNTHIKHLILEDNWITPESAVWLGEMLRENNSIRVLSLRECRLGPKGIANCMDGLGLNQSLRELDLSYNDLGDESIPMLVDALKESVFVEKLNLGHNNLGEGAGKILGDWFTEGNNVDYLNLSWNDFYTGKSMRYLCDGFAESDSLQYLNLSWNGIGRPEALAPLIKYLKSTEKLEHLDLSFNRLMGKLILMMRAGLMANNSLKSINLGFNLITPGDAITLTSVFKREKPLDYMDLQNVFVEKRFLPIWKRLTAMDKNVRIEGILDNYTIMGPDKVKLLFERCRYLAQKPKKKKKKKEFGSQFIWSLPDEQIDTEALKKLVKKAKIKLDANLITSLGEQFAKKKKRIDLKLMHDTYLEIYPETQPPPPPKKKKGKKGKKGKKQEPVLDQQEQTEAAQEQRPSTEEKATGTESIIMPKSSIVNPKDFEIGAIQLKSASVSVVKSGVGSVTKRPSVARQEPPGPEQLVSLVSLETAQAKQPEVRASLMAAGSVADKIASRPSGITAVKTETSLSKIKAKSASKPAGLTGKSKSGVVFKDLVTTIKD